MLWTHSTEELAGSLERKEASLRTAQEICEVFIRVVDNTEEMAQGSQ